MFVITSENICKSNQNSFTWTPVRNCVKVCYPDTETSGLIAVKCDGFSAEHSQDTEDRASHAVDSLLSHYPHEGGAE